MTDSLFAVRGQVVLISGGSRGIGRAIAEGFAQRDAQVVITGRDASVLRETADQISGPASEVVPIVCDAADAAAIAELLDQVHTQFGHVDTLVNVAGVNRRKPAESVTIDDYDFVLDINLKGAFLLSQGVGRRMLARKSGCQINIASLNSDRPLRNVAPYAMSKSAMAQMTRALALEWGPSGVRVNALAPGFILTDLTRQLWSDQQMQDWGISNTPLRRLGQPQDMVGTAVFLASPAAAFLTGQVLYVDGGFTAGWAWPIPA